jgi:hypothetical protein
VCPNEGCGGILRAARPIADVLAEIDERTAGPGPLAGDGALLRRCAEEIRRLRAVVLAANNSLDIPDADDAEHQIESHGATLPALVRRWARAIRVTQDILTKHAWEILESAEPAAKSQTLPADASLEARAILAWRTWDQSPPAEPDPVDWSDVPPAGQAAWRAVVRAVDASRHTLTEVPGIVFDVLEKARVFIQPLTDTPHDEAVHAAESGCCRTCYAETMLAEIECAETECRLVENRCHILTFAEQAPKDPNIALWDAINRYTQACGGDPNTRVYGNIERQRAVVDVHRAVDVARGAPPAGSVGGIDTLRKLFINLLEIDARARRLCEDASIDHTTTPPIATVEVDHLEALDAALNAVDPSEEYDPAMRDMLLAQLDAALSRGAAPAARSTASAELLARQAAAILSEDEHAEEETRAGIEQLNRSDTTDFARERHQ